ncbi:MAG: hypothetical protein ACI9F9_000295 [Candidatus Paceibacteria bacterium]|jgi:hypothetical protein
MSSINRILGTCALPLALVAAISAASSAQGINIDFDDSFSFTPTGPAYGAAGTAGTWNSALVGGTSIFPLVDKAGAPTSVVMTVSASMSLELFFSNPTYGGEDGNLMQDIAYGSGVETIDFAGLANGVYDIYTYAQAPDSKTGFVTGVNCSESGDGLQAVGGAPWSGSHVQGVTYAKHTATVTAGTLHLDITAIASFESVNGIQIEPSGNVGVAYCFGDGSGTACPCSANGAPGAGCLNTSGAGAVMVGSGNASFSSDTFQFDISGIPGDKPGLLLKNDNQVSIPAGDGLICTVGMGAARSQVQITSMGSTTFTEFNAGGTGTGAPLGSVANMGIPTNYQFWYRDPMNPCTGAGFNFSNAWTVTYTP